MDKKSILQQYMLSYSGKSGCNSQEKTITPSTTAQEVTPDQDYTCLSKVTVEAVTSAIDSNIIAENIKKDVSILGVKGTLESGGGDADGIIDKTITSIESNVTSIGDNVFQKCSALANASFPNATSMGGNAFSDCSSLTSIDMPQVTNVGYGAFKSCSKLTSITIPNATNIEGFAFRYCSSLTSIDIPKVTSIGLNAFYDCSALISIDISKVTSIEDFTFSYCSSLTSIKAPKVTSIGQRAFEWSNCKLFDFRGATQVPTLKSITAFDHTSSSKKIVVPDSLYDSWITATNWSSTDHDIVNCIIKASDYEASL